MTVPLAIRAVECGDRPGPPVGRRLVRIAGTIRPDARIDGGPAGRAVAPRPCCWSSGRSPARPSPAATTGLDRGLPAPSPRPPPADRGHASPIDARAAASTARASNLARPTSADLRRQRRDHGRSGELDVATIVEHVGRRPDRPARAEHDRRAARLHVACATRSTAGAGQPGQRPDDHRAARRHPRRRRDGDGPDRLPRDAADSLSGSNWMFTKVNGIVDAVPLDPVGQPGDAVRPAEPRRPVRDAGQPEVSVDAHHRPPARPRGAGDRVAVFASDGLTQRSRRATSATSRSPLAPDFRDATVDGRRRRRSATTTARRRTRRSLLDAAADAFRAMQRASATYPYPIFKVVQSAGGYGMESPG